MREKLAVLCVAAALGLQSGALSWAGLWSSAQVAAVLMGLLLLLLLGKQEDILYIPQPMAGLPRGNEVDPMEFADLPFEHVNLDTADGAQVHGWFIKQHADDAAANRARPTLLYFHGNAGNVSNRLPYYHKLWESLGVNIVAADYRGFGDSGDHKPSEAGLKHDALAFLHFALAHPEVDPAKLVVFGRSLGGAVAVHLAASACDADGGCAVRGLVLENTFLSVADIALAVYPFLRPLRPLLSGPLLRSQWLSKELIQKVPCPILFFSGQQDALVPAEHMTALFNLSPKVAGTRFCSVPKGGHNDTPIRAGPQYYEALQSFVDAAVEDDARLTLDSVQPCKRRDTCGSIESIESVLTDDDEFHMFQ